MFVKPPGRSFTRPRLRLAVAVAVAALLFVGCGEEAVVDGRVGCTPVDSGVTSVVVEPPWEPGLVRTYEIASSTDFGGGLEVALPSPGWARLHVDQGTGGLAMAWEGVPSNVALTVWQFGGDPLTATRATYDWGDGRVRPEVTNPFELGLWLGRAVDRTRLELDTTQLASFDQNTALYEGLFGPDFDLLFLSPAEMLHTFEGLELEVGEPRRVTRQILNGITDEPLRAEATVEIVDIEDDNGCVSLRMHRTPDTDDLAAALSRSADVDGSLVQTLTAQYDAGSGFVKHVIMTTEVGVDGVTVSDTTSVVDLTTERP